MISAVHAVAAPFSMSAAALEELAEKAEALAGRVSSRATKASDEFEEDEEEDDASYFKMKQELLTTYCGMLSYYLCRKARGESIQDHPVVRRLYELRLTFEKLRLLDAKLRHQLDKVLARADAADVAPVANLESVELDKEEGTYKPPRSTVAYQEKDEASSDEEQGAPGESRSFSLKRSSSSSRRAGVDPVRLSPTPSTPEALAAPKSPTLSRQSTKSRLNSPKAGSRFARRRSVSRKSTVNVQMREHEARSSLRDSASTRNQDSGRTDVDVPFRLSAKSFCFAFCPGFNNLWPSRAAASAPPSAAVDSSSSPPCVKNQ